MASTAFTNMFLSSPRPDAGILDFDSLQIVPSDFWRRHFLVHDDSFRKLGNCDFHRGVWYFTPIGFDTSFMGFTRDDVTKAWLTIPFALLPFPHILHESPELLHGSSGDSLFIFLNSGLGLAVVLAGNVASHGIDHDGRAKDDEQHCDDEL